MKETGMSKAATHPAAEPKSNRTELLTAAQIQAILREAMIKVNLNKSEYKVISDMSSQIGGRTKKEVARDMEKSLWDIYNIRRNGLRKIAKLLHVWDEEALFPMLGLKRGRRLPVRNTRYLEKTGDASVEQEETKVEDSNSDEEENIDDGGEAAVDEYKTFGDPDPEDKDSEEGDDEDDEEDE